MHLISTEEFNLRVNDVNAVFNSTAEEVVKESEYTESETETLFKENS